MKQRSAGRGLGPNERLIGQQGSRAALTSPAVVVDIDILDANLALMQGQCVAAGLGLRPHAKTHKSSAIARRQIKAGALGVCCATIREAEAMVDAGIPGVLISSPVVGDDKIARLVAAARRAEGLMTVVDDPHNAAAIDAALGGAAAGGAAGGGDGGDNDAGGGDADGGGPGSDKAGGGGAVAGSGSGDRDPPLGVLVDVDIGMHRTGVTSPDDAVALARIVTEAKYLRWRGIQAYSGKVQHIDGFAERAVEYGAQLDQLRAVLKALAEAGLVAEIVSGGGTGTFAIDARAAGIDSGAGLFTEHQAGSYLFMDVEYAAVELFPDRPIPYGTALSILNRVVSANADGIATIDGGFKCFATDGPLPTVLAGAPAGTVYRRFGDEHGCLVLPEGARAPALGEAVTMMAPHCDPTINLHDWYHIVSGDTLVDIWPIDGRGVL